MNELIQQLLGKDDGEHAMTKAEKEHQQKLLDNQEQDDVSWKPDREATQMAIREMIMKHPTEFEQLLRKHHDQSGLEFKSVWLDQVNKFRIAA